MKLRRSLLIVLALAALGLIGWRLLVRLNAPATPPAVPAPIARPDPVLEFRESDLMTVAPAGINRSIPVTGTVRAVDQTVVRAKVAGELRDLSVLEGMSVKAGQLLARIDPTDFEARVREREAQARAAEAQVELTRRNLEAQQALVARNFISQNAFDGTRSSHDVALANRDAAQAQLAQARKALADTAVLAPMSGQIAERFAQVGEKLSPDNRILSIVDLSRLEIEAPVPASEVGAVRTGQTVSLQIEGIDTPQTGTVVRINPGTAAGTRSVPVYIGLRNRDGRVRAGLFAQGQLVVERRAQALTVPSAALRDTAAGPAVYVIDQGKLAERRVRVGLRDESTRSAQGHAGSVEILEGLKEGERVVAVNLGELRVGATANILSAKRP